ncbi:hypothetical protein HanPI659440_Chr17g0703171 [Helianthus annuus]|nr:hypothetical protein HanPI659440_Chr17g0703171 [Helianthus annuus]
MVNMTTFFGMSIGAFVFWQSMDKVHVWIALHQDEKGFVDIVVCNTFMCFWLDEQFRD